MKNAMLHIRHLWRAGMVIIITCFCATQVAAQSPTVEYATAVMQHLNNQNAPSIAHSGTATIEFEIGRRGQLLKSSLYKSSGSNAFDAEALSIVRGAAPFPRPSAGVLTSYRVILHGSKKEK